MCACGCLCARFGVGFGSCSSLKLYYSAAGTLRGNKVNIKYTYLYKRLILATAKASYLGYKVLAGGAFLVDLTWR